MFISVSVYELSEVKRNAGKGFSCVTAVFCLALREVEK